MNSEQDALCLPCEKRFPGITSGLTHGEVSLSAGDAVEVWALRGVRHVAVKSISAESIAFNIGKPLKLADLAGTEHYVESGRIVLFHKSINGYKEPTRRH